jgi:hypothetical protein
MGTWYSGADRATTCHRQGSLECTLDAAGYVQLRERSMLSTTDMYAVLRRALRRSAGRSGARSLQRAPCR